MFNNYEFKGIKFLKHPFFLRIKSPQRTWTPHAGHSPSTGIMWSDEPKNRWARHCMCVTAWQFGSKQHRRSRGGQFRAHKTHISVLQAQSNKFVSFVDTFFLHETGPWHIDMCMGGNLSSCGKLTTLPFVYCTQLYDCLLLTYVEVSSVRHIKPSNVEGQTIPRPYVQHFRQYANTIVIYFFSPGFRSYVF